MEHPDIAELIGTFSAVNHATANYLEDIVFMERDPEKAARQLCCFIDPYSYDPTPAQEIWVAFVLYPSCLELYTAALQDMDDQTAPNYNLP